MKKIMCFVLIILSIPNVVFADSGKSSIVMDVKSGRVLYSKDEHTKRLIASTTKIMTAIIVIENMDINKEIIVGNEVLKMYGTNIYIEPNEKLRVIDLLYGLLLRSGNDAALTLALNCFSDLDKFVKLMNDKANELGMNNTIFNNPHGLDEDTKNYSTAYDMALLAKYAYNNKIYKKIISTKKYITKSSLKSYVWYNRMSLINKYDKCIGGKNGYTPKAGKSLVSYAKNNKLTLLIVSLDDDSIYENHKKLYEKYFDLYDSYLILDKKLKYNNYYIKNSFSYPLTKREVEELNTLIEIYNNDSKGKIKVRIKDKVIAERNLYKKNGK